MGGEILREEGFEVEAVADGQQALALIVQFDPLVILADAQLPGKSGYELSKEAKSLLDSVAVVLTLGASTGTPDADRLRQSGCDATISKPFEATALLDTVKRLAASVQTLRAASRRSKNAATSGELDRERVEAAVTLALEASLPSLIQEITERLLIALRK